MNRYLRFAHTHRRIHMNLKVSDSNKKCPVKMPQPDTGDLNFQ